MHAGLSVEAVPSPLTSALLFPLGFFDTRFLFSLHAKLHIHSVRLTSSPLLSMLAVAVSTIESSFSYVPSFEIDHDSNENISYL
jgi:hypothetical protein